MPPPLPEWSVIDYLPSLLEWFIGVRRHRFAFLLCICVSLSIFSDRGEFSALLLWWLLENAVDAVNVAHKRRRRSYFPSSAFGSTCLNEAILNHALKVCSEYKVMKFEDLKELGSESVVKWDILSNDGVVQEMAHIANGRNTRNCVSLLRVNKPTGVMRGLRFGN